MRLTSLLVLFVVISFMSMGSYLYDQDLEDGEFRDIYNFTESKIVWDSSVLEPKYYSPSDNQIYNRLSRANNIIYKFTDFIGYSFVEGGKMSLEFGYNNPQYDFEYFVGLLKYYLVVFVLITLIPVVIPILAVIFIIFQGLGNLFRKYNPPIKSKKEFKK